MKVQIAGFERRQDIQVMKEATLRKSQKDDSAEILRLQELSKRQVAALVEVMGQVGEL